VNIRQQQQQQQQQRANNQTTSVTQTPVETSSTLTDKRSNDRIRMGSVVSQTSNRSSVSISSEHPARMNLFISNTSEFLFFQMN
jgi:hypothetical protein